MWWAITTVTTVGYGDGYPVTTTGRIVAALLMLGGISLIGAITATFASWIVERVAAEDSSHQAATAGHIEDLRGEIRALRRNSPPAARSLLSSGSRTQVAGEPRYSARYCWTSARDGCHCIGPPRSWRFCGSTPRP